MRSCISNILLGFFVLPVTSWSAGLLVGHVRIHGSIIEAPCSITLGSRDQSIDMSVLPIEQIIRDGRGPTQPFSIRIVGCNLAPASVSQHQLSTFGVTFDGSTTNDDLFAVHGLGRGVGLQIANEEGDVATPGQKMPVSMLAESGVWNYTLRLIADRNPLRAGSYRATVQFKLDYY